MIYFQNILWSKNFIQPFFVPCDPPDTDSLWWFPKIISKAFKQNLGKS